MRGCRLDEAQIAIAKRTVAKGCKLEIIEYFDDE